MEAARVLSGVLRVGKPQRYMPEQAAGVPGCPAAGYGRARSTYVRRRPEDTVLHRVVREHLETFLAEARLRGGGEGLPAFVEREFRRCGSGC
jgi:hypothetical protein